MRKSKLFLLIATSLFISLPFVIKSSPFTSVNAVAGNWTKTAGPDATVTSNNEYTKIKGMTSHGSNYRSSDFFSLDGLHFDFAFEGFDSQCYGGFGFSNVPAKTDGSQLGWGSGNAPSFCFWPNLYNANQTRIWIGASHDYNQKPYLYADPALTKNYAYSPETTTLVFSLVSNNNLYYGGAHFGFKRYSPTVYEVTVSELPNLNTITAWNPNYDSKTKSTKVYIPTSNIPCIGLTDHVYLNLQATSPSGSKNGSVTIANIFNEHDLPAQTEWTGTTSLSLSNTLYGLRIDKLNGWGQKAVKNNKVHLDGLNFNFKMSKYMANDAAGFYFTKSSTLTDGKGFDSSYAPCFSVLSSVSNGNSRLHVGNDHDHSKASTIYRDAACKQAGFSSSSKDLLIKPTSYEGSLYTGFNVLFENIKTAWKVTFTQHTLYGSFVSSSASNLYNNGYEYRVAMYFPSTTFSNILDSSGNCYLTVAGWVNDVNVTLNNYLLVDDLKESNAKYGFIQDFLNNLTCDPNGKTAPSKTKWTSLSNSFAALSEADKASLRNTKSNTSSNASNLEKMVAKYDYIIAKYGTNAYSNFIGRDKSILLTNEGIAFSNNTNLSFYILLACSLTSLTTFIFFIKKRKMKGNE